MFQEIDGWSAKLSLLASIRAHESWNTIADHPNPKLLANALLILVNTTLFMGEKREENFELLASNISHEMLAVFQVAYYARLFEGEHAQIIFNTIANHKNLLSLSLAAHILRDAGFLRGSRAKQNFYTVASHQQLNFLSETLSQMFSLRLLNTRLAQTYLNSLLHHQDISQVFTGLSLLLDTPLLTGLETTLIHQNISMMLSHGQLDKLNLMLFELLSAGLLTNQAAQANFTIVMTHPDIARLYNLFLLLNTAHLLEDVRSQKNFTKIAKRYTEKGTSNLHSLHKTFKLLSEIDLLNPQNGQAIFNDMMRHLNPLGAARALKAMHDAGLLSGKYALKNHVYAIRHSNPCCVTRGIILLHQAGGFDNEYAQANLRVILKHSNPWGAACALKVLHNAGLLTDENRSVILRHPNPAEVADGIELLDEADLLQDTLEWSQSFFDEISTSVEPWKAACSIKQAASQDEKENHPKAKIKRVFFFKPEPSPTSDNCADDNAADPNQGFLSLAATATARPL